MTLSLYLDTARLGRMCPEAQQADRDFAQLAGEEAGSLYFDFFLQNGFYSLPPNLRNHYVGLSDWSGTASLKNRLKTALGVSRERTVFFANRSAQLVRLAARTLCSQCENILVTDMLWPAYRQTLEAECHQNRRMLVVGQFRQLILRESLTQEEFVDAVVDFYREQNCDGLFLSAVTYQGVRLPINQIVRAVSELARPGFVVVDGAQAVNHTPLELDQQHCDFLVAGCHKWLRAYHPMGLGLCCRSSAEEALARVFREMVERGELDDPLLTFSRALETDDCERFSETVNLSSLFTTSAAVSRIWNSARGCREEFTMQVAAANRAAELTRGTGWRPVQPDGPMRSGILLLQAKRAETRSAPPDVLRFAFRRRGVSLSAYEGGLIRLSLPPEPLEADSLNHIRAALRASA